MNETQKAGGIGVLLVIFGNTWMQSVYRKWVDGWAIGWWISVIGLGIIVAALFRMSGKNDLRGR